MRKEISNEKKNTYLFSKFYVYLINMPYNH